MNNKKHNEPSNAFLDKTPFKNKYKIIIITIIIFTLIACAYFIFTLLNPNRDGSLKTGGIRVCPTAWYEDRMPTTDKIDDPTDRQYFIVNGENKSYDEMDVEWVKLSCDINTPDIVQ